MCWVSMVAIVAKAAGSLNFLENEPIKNCLEVSNWL